jgi:glucan 1,3-beta-glucosidase
MQSLLACALLLQALSPAAAGAAPRPLVRTGASCVSWYDTLEPTRNNNYTYRNVRWYGAKGDGITDDTAAFQTALTYNRSPLFSLSTPLVLYVPPGDYVVKSTLTLFFLTHMVGNSLCPPRLVVPPGTLRAPMSFVLSGDTSYDGEHDDEFYRGVRHIDIVLGAGNTGGCGVHWAVSQATFLRDMVIDLGPDGQYGIFDENGRLVLPSPPLLPSLLSLPPHTPTAHARPFHPPPPPPSQWRVC